MSLIVASLFLPYTVEFEVVEDKTSQANETESIVDVANLTLSHPNASRTTVSRPSFSKQNSSIGDVTSILKTMAKKQQLKSPEMYSSLNNSKTNLLLNEDDLTKASVEDFFYHHPKLRRSSPSGSVSQYSSGTATPQDMESSDKPFNPQQHNTLLKSALNSSGTYIQPRARTPPVVNSSAVVDPSKKEPQTPSLKFIAKNQSSSNVSTTRNQSSYTRSSLYKLSDRKEFSSSEHIPYEAAYDDSGIALSNYNDNEDSHISYDIPDKITPYGGFSNPDKAHQFQNNRCEFFSTAPFEVVKAKRGNISLAKAVESAGDHHFINKEKVKWVGTLAMPSDEVPDSTRDKISKQLNDSYQSDVVFIDDVTFQGHYKSFCKQILWPSLHYQIPDNPKSKVFEEHSWEYYTKVNEMFAQRIIDSYKEGDIVWVHDYHLLLVPQLIRKAIPNAKIGLFLHVSFPSSEVFRCFAQRDSLLKGMLGANVISFQTEEYVRHFAQTCNRLLLSDYSTDGIKYDGRTIKIDHIPVGIDARALKEKLTTSEEIQYWKKAINKRWPNKKLIVSRDRVDKIRGIKQKLLAYEKFLNKNPEFLDEVIMIQICLPSGNQDEDLESSINTIVDRINARSNNISLSQPVVLLNQDIDFEQYLALLTEADTFIVSTMREGMNLTCHEFIVSTYEKKSPLILSEFTGSASILQKGAILINPWYIKQVAEAFETALTKSPEEKAKSWQFLNSFIYKQDSNHWVESCINSIQTAWNDSHSKTIPSTCSRQSFLEKYNKSTVAKNVFLFNLENLTATVQYENSKVTTVELSRIFSILTSLTSNPRNVVYVMSYFKKTDLQARFRQIPNLGLVAENGAYVKMHDSNKWYTVVEDDQTTWKSAVIDYANSIVERVPKSSLEIEDCTVRFHTEFVRAEDSERKITLTGELITHINDVFANQKIHATWFNDVVVIQPVHLPEKALQLICHAVNNKHSLDAEYKNVVPDSPTSVHSPITEEATPSIDHVGFLCIMGGQSPTDESLFHYGLELEAHKKVDELLSIEVGKVKRSLANQYVGGINEIFNILNEL